MSDRLTFKDLGFGLKILVILAWIYLGINFFYLIAGFISGALIMLGML